MNPRDIKDGIESYAAEAATHLKSAKVPLRAWFPRGWIRKLSDHQGRWSYLSHDRRRTLCCVLQLCDINRFHLALWEIKLTAGAMWAWQCSVPVIAVIETLLYEVCRQHSWVNSGEGFKKCINICNSRGVYGEALKVELHALRDYRNEIHLFLKEGEVELHDGKPKEYNRAVRALHSVEKTLDEFFKSQNG